MNSGFYGNPPEVSVLMSCYNASRWLRIAIESVLCQTFNNFEFILIDDGSTDETWEIIQAYREKDKRIVAIRKKNTGLQDSLNIGIWQARGVWIARLDADDLCERDRLAEQLKYVQNNPEVVLLGTGFIEIDEEGWIIKRHLFPSGHRKLVLHLKRLQRFFPHSSAFFKNETAKRIGFYNSLFKKSQDWDFWLRFSERGRIACLKNCLVRVRNHMEQISHSAKGTSQLVYGTAASTCHFLRVGGFHDPSSGSDEATWKGFLDWIEMRIIDEGMLEKQKAWTDARAKYSARESKLVNSVQFATNLLKSSHVGGLVWGRFFGSSLPQRLAREWMVETSKQSASYIT